MITPSAGSHAVILEEGMCQQGQQGALAVPDDIDGVVGVTLADDLDQHGQAHGRKDHVLAPCRRKQRMGHGAAEPGQRDETEQLAVETLAPTCPAGWWWH